MSQREFGEGSPWVCGVQMCWVQPGCSSATRGGKQQKSQSQRSAEIIKKRSRGLSLVKVNSETFVTMFARIRAVLCSALPGQEGNISGRHRAAPKAGPAALQSVCGKPGVLLNNVILNILKGIHNICRPFPEDRRCGGFLSFPVTIHLVLGMNCAISSLRTTQLKPHLCARCKHPSVKNKQTNPFCAVPQY